MNQEENKELEINNEQPVEPVVEQPKEEPAFEPIVTNTEPVAEPIVTNEPVEQNETATTEPVIELTPVNSTAQTTEEKETKVEVEENVLEVEDPQARKRKTTLLIIFFIFLFGFVMGMPYINEFVDKLKKDTGMSDIERRAREIEKEQNKEKEKQQQSKKQEPKQDETNKEQEPVVQPEPEVLSKVTCTITVPATEEVLYDRTTVQVFEYNKNNEVVTSEIQNTYTFTEQNASYLTQKSKCDENSLKYIDNEGYSFNCSYTDLSVVIGNKFELETFKPIVDGDTTIIANATKGEKIDGLRTRLTGTGYTCE